MQYQTPSIKSEKIELGTAWGQYDILITPDCPAYIQRGVVIHGNTAAFCSDPQTSGGASDINATLICSNIDGQFELHTDEIAPGGGLTCPQGQISFEQTYTTNLTADCVIDQVLFNLGNGTLDACELVG